MALPFLEQFGLTAKEARIYEILLKLGESPAGAIIKETGFKRATVYKSLYSLEDKSLVNQKKTGTKILFKPASPTQLTALAEAQMRSLERARSDLQAILPDLKSEYILSVERPVVSTFEGVEGLKQIYLDTIREGKPIYAALTTHEVDPKLYTWLLRSYTKKRVEAKIFAYVLVSSEGEFHKYVKRDAKEMRETRVVSAETYPFEHEINIFGDKVAFIDFRKSGSLIGIIIHHPRIAKTMMAIWNIAWDSLKEQRSA